jgi:putative ABC transport system permease protein
MQDVSVRGIAPSSDIPGKTVVDRNGMRQASQDKTHNYLTFISQVDEHFLGTYGMSLAAGRNLRRSDTMNPFTDHAGKIGVLVNEKIVQALGYKNNEAAINQDIIFSYGPGEHAGQIVGVVRNYHQRSLKEGFDPMLYIYPTFDNWRYFSIQVKPDHLQQTMGDIERVYKEVFAGNPYEYFFLNEYFGRQYQSDQRFGKVFGLFTALAIFVACLGLLGLSAFMIRLRTKETGIRKVLGASIYSLLVLFSKDFVKLVAVATIIAIPLVYWGASSWLRNYAFHIRLDWVIFLGPPILLLVISLAMIGVQSLKTALTNPVNSLKSE